MPHGDGGLVPGPTRPGGTPGRRDVPRAEFVRLGRDVPGVLYRPAVPSDVNHIAVLVMHSDSDYLSFSAGEELSRRGYHVLCANVSGSRASLDTKIGDVGKAVTYLRDLPQIRKILLLGHSGGATLLTAYQNLAENGPAAFQGPEKLVPCSHRLSRLPATNGVILVDSNWGNGAMRLFSLDPAVLDEDSGVEIDPGLDLFAPANGFRPDGSHYPADFVRAFQRAQGERNLRLIDRALERLDVIEAGRGRYLDDEPFVVPGAEQGFRNNKLYAQDIRLMSRTRRPQNLLHVDGTTTTEIIRTLRKPENNRSCTASYHDGALVTTVRGFLTSWAVRTTDEYGFDESSVRGVDWASSYNCTPGNVNGIVVPLLVMGMTAGWEFAAAETIWDNATSSDKTLVYVEGADHLFRTSKTIERYPGQFGDTLTTTYDYIHAWISSKEAFHD